MECCEMYLQLKNVLNPNSGFQNGYNNEFEKA